ncbi:MAG TPA: hypothetical protein PLW44_03835 [Chitinophagales bacterium]|nr:hypothetical protein [Chitinophagales bacterium]
MEQRIAAYQLAQTALASLKTAIYSLLLENPNGMTNAQIGKSLGIYYGHSGKQEGHIPRTMLEIMEKEGVVEQKTKGGAWFVKQN